MGAGACANQVRLERAQDVLAYDLDQPCLPPLDRVRVGLLRRRRRHLSAPRGPTPRTRHALQAARPPSRTQNLCSW